jgi:hypothetical protein
MPSPHLTPEQRKTLLDLFEQADTAEALRCVAGIVSHNIEDLTLALSVGETIRRVANDVSKYERSQYRIEETRGQQYAVTGPQGHSGLYPSLHAAKLAFPGATVVKS